MSRSALLVAVDLRSQAIDRDDDLSLARWLATPEVWNEIRFDKDSTGLVTVTGPHKQSLIGIPLHIVGQGTIPALDLVFD